ncbi:MAG: hypothetical protein QME81_07485 [bacterium]|nr:hypothetical protein [bacterium]
MDNSQEKRWTGPQVTFAVLTALAAVFGQMIAFFYELGHARTFGWPSALIKIDNTAMLWVALLATAIVALIFFIIFFITEKSAERFSRFAPAITAVVIALLIIFLGVPFSFPVILHKFLWVVIGGMLFAIVGVVSLFVYPALVPPKLPLAKENAGSWFAFFRSPFGRVLRLFVGLAIILPLCAFTKGIEDALTQPGYYVVEHEGCELVVLRIQGDKAICAPFDRETNHTESRFFVLTIGADQKLALRWEMTGPLRPKAIADTGRE